MEPIPSTGLPHYRAIVALDIERSTSRPDSVKAELRNKTYELFDTALHAAGIHKRHRDRYIDRGDGLLALIHPVDQVPKALLLNRAIPALSSLLADYNASLPDPSRLQRQLRVRVVTHAGDVRYDANGCFGEALDVAFRLLERRPRQKSAPGNRRPVDPCHLGRYLQFRRAPRLRRHRPARLSTPRARPYRGQALPRLDPHTRGKRRNR